MSDDEDNQALINEIQALKNALDRNGCISDSSLQQYVLPKAETACGKDQIKNVNIEEPDKDFKKNDYYENYNCKGLQDLLELNKQLIDLISLNRDKLTALLEECTRKQQIIEDQISKHSTCVSRIVSFNAGMPYFKDRNYFTAKRNIDTETKIRNGELRLRELQRINRWTQIDKTNLLKTIRHEVTLTLLGKNELDEEQYIDNTITKTSQLPNDVKIAIGSLGTMKFDWLKIANELPGNKHSAEECEVMWNIFLHPEINKQKWSSKEDKNLKRIVVAHQFEDWDTIAKELKTNRSGYQCFIRYNTNNWKNLMKGQSWRPKDDKMLTKLVTILKIGDYIPWGYIASCMLNWTKQQVYFRWIYSLAPHIKKGRFSEEEDRQLTNAIAKYGTNYSKISALVMTHRTNIQLKDHFQLVMSKKSESKKLWKIEEDERILELHKMYGRNWKKIASQLPKTSRIQVRQRFGALLRYQAKGISLKAINRSEDCVTPNYTTVTYTTNTSSSRENKQIVVKHAKIDNQLINFFKRDNIQRKLEQNQKLYHPDKLNHDKRKLYDILYKLNANLDIPKDISGELQLSQFHQQLLIALENYSEERKSNLNQNVETIRLKMFGPLKKIPNEQRFIPPLPFGFRAPKVKNKNNISLNYSLDTTQFHQVVVIMLLETNKHVTEYLGEDTEMEFEKLKKIMTNKTRNIRKKKIYSLKCKSFANSLCFLDDPQDTENSESNLDTDLSSKNRKYNWELNKLVSNDSDVDKTILDSASVLNIDPNRSILQAYQELLFISENASQSNESNTNFKLTPRGQQALYLFKRRYQQLFQIPTGLSRIVPPDTVDESVFLPSLEKLKKQNLKRKRLK